MLIRNILSGTPAIAMTAALGSALLGGCQSYEPRPIDLAQHRASVLARDTALLTPDTAGLISPHIARPDAGHTPGVFDASDGLSLPEGQALAMFYNPDLRVSRMQAGVALAEFETAGLWQDPEFGFDASDILSSNAPTETGFVLSLSIPISGRLGVEKDRAGAHHAEALARVVHEEWAVRAEVRRAWIAWSTGQERAALLQGLVEQVESIVQIAEDLGSAGELSRIESRLFVVELAKRQAELSRATADKRRARMRLLALLGLSPESTFVLQPGLANAAEIPEASVIAMIERNTELATLRAAYRAAEQSLRLAIREQYPDIAIGAGYGNEDDDRLLLGVSIPIPVLNANRPAIARARAEREVARASAHAAAERFEHALAQARLEDSEIRNQRAGYEEIVLPLLDEQAADVRRVIELGEFDALLVLETVSGMFEAQVAMLELRQSELISATNITELIGPPPVLPGQIEFETTNGANP